VGELADRSSSVNSPSVRPGSGTPDSASTESAYVPTLGLPSAVALVVGSMIGSGIFIVPADIARLTRSPALFIATWLVTAFLTVSGALAYGELAAMLPKAGGQYVFLREAFGPLAGFLYGWTLFAVIQTGTIAAVCVAFAKFAGHFFPVIAGDRWLWHVAEVPRWRLGPCALGGYSVGVSTQNLVAILAISVLTLVNARGVALGAVVQNVFTATKTVALALLVLVGIGLSRNATAVAENFGDFWRGCDLGARFAVESAGRAAEVGVIAVVGMAQVGSLFSADAWNNVTFAAAEVKNPSRGLPLALALGTGLVLVLYVAANFAYLCVLPLGGEALGNTPFGRGIAHASGDRVGSAMMESAFGPSGAGLMALLVLVSTFGCANGLVLSGARVYWAMARDGLFFRAVAELHPTWKTPVRSLALQAVWSSVLCLSGSYGQLLDYVVFAVLIFYAATIVGLFVLRVRQPEASRPYRAVGYPVLPAAYVILALTVAGVLLRYKPEFTWPGLVLVLTGVPVYYAWQRWGRALGA
jgi:basic amino acid/polyamine antiporter, APA family